MKQDNDLLKKLGNDDGMRVPDGYFADFARQMEQKLPPLEFENPEPKVLPRSRWQQVRPYVYLAAMFMGIWCMMKMFNLMGGNDSTLSIDNNPTLISAITDETFFDEYYSNTDGIDDFDLLEDMYNEGVSTSDFIELASYK